MREDIVGMLKNAIERGGRPDKIAESLIASGYNALEVQQALSYVTGGTLASLSAPQQQTPQLRPAVVQQNAQQAPKGYSPYPQYQQYPQSPQVLQAPPQISRPLPVSKNNSSEGTLKVIVIITILILLIGGLVSTIIFKDDILKIFG